MPIYAEDIRTRQAAVAGQFPESGGRIHPTDYVVHNEIGNLLPKLTEIDHAGGRVDLAKCYLSIETTGVEQGDDCYTYLDEAPADPLVDCVLLRPAGVGERSGHTDERAEAQAYIEAYQLAAGLSPWYLRGLHTAGMRTLTLWSREDVRLPEVGQTLYLVAFEGEGGEYGQYVQISDFSYETQTFSGSPSGDECGKYSRRLIYCTLTSYLRDDYTGPEVTCTDPGAPDTRIRECRVADGTRYYGRSPIAAAVTAGATSLQVADIYGYAVPSARGEMAITALPALSAGNQDIVSGPETFSVSGPVHTQRIQVTTGNRALNWTRILLPIPGGGGKVRAHVRILDRWYTVVEGESGTVGTLTCNRTSGSTLLTLTALPDADTWLIWEWPSAIHFTDRAGTALVAPVAILFDLPSVPEIGTLVLTWTSGGVAKTAGEGSNRVLTGDGDGTRVATHVALYIAGAAIPDGGTQVGYSYQPLATITESITPTVVGANAQFTLGNLPRPGSVTVTWAAGRPVPALAVDAGAVPEYPDTYSIISGDA